jgi:hypothetical protein
MEKHVECKLSLFLCRDKSSITSPETNKAPDTPKLTPNAIIIGDGIFLSNLNRTFLRVILLFIYTLLSFSEPNY